ncbi:MAG: undecaprenyldiphospho-muramoylpentapeptide beta-N-acetylglucosaminyltransferase [Reichenbachiella sp.]|uniref:undecaprenyldiphospho-muramoylpentapeptide beta-N-acetylglucosaminyltransferase n=1 Tax=Reichenbachiella sp. TaxID=2184521 RepID=UPI0032678EEE
MIDEKTYRQNPLRIMISGGGTGGHIYPAIAIANALNDIQKDIKFLFVGANGRMEMEKVPEAGYDIVGLWISGLQRKLTLGNLSFPFKVISSIWKSFSLLKKFRPDVVIGVGGYASGPLLYAANKKGIPTLIQEQNSYPGITNKLLAGKANKICVAYPGMERFFQKEKLVETGNPVRTDIMNSDNVRLEGLSQFGFRSDKKTVLILGGSLGARTINNTLAEGVERLIDEDVQVLWQSGKFYFDEMKERTAHIDSEKLRIVPFIKDMDRAYGAADVVISRAGALSISELCLVGKPVLFVPSPNVAEDHQTKNAMALVSREAAEMIRDDEAGEHLITETLKLLKNEEQQKIIRANIKELAKPNAAKDIAHEIFTMIK